jgi:hypothetical protein
MTHGATAIIAMKTGALMSVAISACSFTLRAPLAEQRRLRAEYSSSESRILIMRKRGFRTGMLDSETSGVG